MDMQLKVIDFIEAANKALAPVAEVVQIIYVPGSLMFEVRLVQNDYIQRECLFVKDSFFKLMKNLGSDYLDCPEVDFNNTGTTFWYYIPKES